MVVLVNFRNNHWHGLNAELWDVEVELWGKQVENNKKFVEMDNAQNEVIIEIYEYLNLNISLNVSQEWPDKKKQGEKL